MDGRGNNLKKFSKKRTKRKTTTYSKLPNISIDPKTLGASPKSFKY